MDDEIIDTPLIDTHLDSYKKFFDNDWAERIFEAVRASPLKHAANALVVAWRSANGAHILPWLMATSLQSFAKGEVTGNLRYRESYTAKVIKTLVDKLEGMMKFKLNLDHRQSLKRAVARIEKEGYEAVKTAQEQVRFDVAGYWEFLTNNSEFQFSILGTQRINYGSLFFAYEDFLANVIRTREPTYSSKKEPIKTAFAKHFGAPTADFCWNHDEVELAKLVRNALAHNGGRFGTDLEKYRARFVDASGLTAVPLRGDRFNLVDGKIQITPEWHFPSRQVPAVT